MFYVRTSSVFAFFGRVTPLFRTIGVQVLILFLVEL